SRRSPDPEFTARHEDEEPALRTVIREREHDHPYQKPELLARLQQHGDHQYDEHRLDHDHPFFGRLAGIEREHRRDARPHEKGREGNAQGIDRYRASALSEHGPDKRGRSNDHGKAEVVGEAPRQPMRIHHAYPDIRQYAEVRTEQDDRNESEYKPEQCEVSHGRAAIRNTMRTTAIVI